MQGLYTLFEIVRNILGLSSISSIPITHLQWSFPYRKTVKRHTNDAQTPTNIKCWYLDFPFSKFHVWQSIILLWFSYFWHVGYSLNIMLRASFSPGCDRVLAILGFSLFGPPLVFVRTPSDIRHNLTKVRFFFTFLIQFIESHQQCVLF